LRSITSRTISLRLFSNEQFPNETRYFRSVSRLTDDARFLRLVACVKSARVTCDIARSLPVVGERRGTHNSTSTYVIAAKLRESRRRVRATRSSARRKIFMQNWILGAILRAYSSSVCKDNIRMRRRLCFSPRRFLIRSRGHRENFDFPRERVSSAN